MTALIRARRGPRRRRRLIAALSIVAAVALIVSAVAWTRTADAGSHPDSAERADLEAAARAVVLAVMTVDPTQLHREGVRGRLADPLLSRFDAVGADVVLPGAIASSARISATVVALAVSDYQPQNARVLAFIDQRVRVPHTGAGNSADTSKSEQQEQQIPVEKWLLMRRVNETWLLSDMTPVGDVTQ